MIVLVFFLLPFSYFYAEETLSDDLSGGKDHLDSFFDDHSSSSEEDMEQKYIKKEKKSKICGCISSDLLEKLGKAVRSTVRIRMNE